MLIGDAEVSRTFEACDQAARERSEINIGATHIAGRGDFLVRIAAFHHERKPRFDRRGIVGVGHLRETMVLAHRIEPAPQKCDVRLAADEAHMGDRMDEFIG